MTTTEYVNRAMFINLEGTTRGKKIASTGFGLKADELGYFNSKSLSLLNEKTVAMIYNESQFNGINRFVFTSLWNDITITVNRVSNSTVYATVLNCTFSCYNESAPLRFHKPVNFQISFKNERKNAQTVCRKDAGLITDFSAYGNNYQIAEWHYNNRHEKIIDEWYYTGYSITIK